MLRRTTLSSLRGFHTTSLVSAEAQTRKSFAKKTFFDRSKNRKGTGEDKTYQNLLKSANYKKTAKDSNVLDELTTLKADDIRTGRIVKYELPVQYKMHIAGSFKPGQFNEIYSRPITLLRERETAEIETVYNSSKETYERLMIMGESGVGKSTLLAQFQALALSSVDAVLIPVSDANQLVDGSSDFKLNAKTGLYEQQMFSKNLLKKIAAANANSLKPLKLSKTFQVAKDKSSKAGSSLLDFAIAGSKSSDRSTAILVQLFAELSAQETAPVYLTVDNYSAFVQHALTAYRDARNIPIYFEQFQIAKLLTDYLVGDASFKKGATVVATNGSDKHVKNDTLAVGLGLRREDKYKKFMDFDRELASRLAAGKVPYLTVSKLSVSEIETLLKHMFECNIIHNEYQLDEEIAYYGPEEYLKKLAQRKYIISGNGNARLFVKSCVLAYV